MSPFKDVELALTMYMGDASPHTRPRFASISGANVPIRVLGGGIRGNMSRYHSSDAFSEPFH